MLVVVAGPLWWLVMVSGGGQYWFSGVAVVPLVVAGGTGGIFGPERARQRLQSAGRR